LMMMMMIRRGKRAVGKREKGKKRGLDLGVPGHL